MDLPVQGGLPLLPAASYGRAWRFERWLTSTTPRPTHQPSR